MIFLGVQVTKTTIDLSIDPIAAFALLASTASLLVSIVAIRRDRAKVKIRVSRGWVLAGGYPPTQDKKPKLSVKVYNKGVRPVTIGQVGAQHLRDNGGFIFSDSMINGSREVAPGKAIDCLVNMDEFEKIENKSGVAYIYATDLTGKSYYKGLSGIHKRLIYWPIRRYDAKIRNRKKSIKK